MTLRYTSLVNSRIGWRTTSQAVAATLGIAGVLKLYAELESHGSFSDRWHGVLLSNVELWIAAWLWSGWKPRQARWIAAVCFALFAAISLWKGIQGANSCGCFGRVVVNPWITFALDAAILGLLISSQDVQQFSESQWSLRTWTGLYASFVISILSISVLAVGQRALAEQHGFLIDEENNIVILEPTEWIGREFALARHTSRPQDLVRGKWLVVLFHHGCSVCETLLDQLNAVIDSPVPIALVELPPHSNLTVNRKGLLSASLDPGPEWFVETPSALLVEDGIVLDALSPVPDGSAKTLFEMVERREHAGRLAKGDLHFVKSVSH